MSWFDRIGGLLGYSASASSSPEYQGSRWRGASRTLRSLQNWFPGIGSARSDLPANEQRTLRARSRDAYRSQLIARAALTRCRTNIVGTGLMCHAAVDAKALNLTEDEAAAYNESLQSAFDAWAEEPNDCDWESTLDFYGLQALTLISAMASGDVFALTPHDQRPGNTSELKVQLIEADRVSNPNHGIDSETLVDGVVLTRDGKLSGYWISDTHPGDVISSTRMATWAFYAAFGVETGRRRVLHVWNEKDRPEQVRSAPFLAPILEPLRQLARYGDAELMAAVISAMFTVFIEHEAEGVDEAGNPLPGAFGGAEQSPAGQPAKLSLGNGAIVDLAPGEKANTANPTRPNANFDPFFVALVKQIGAALELPLDELMLQYNASYSAARAAMLQAWRFYTTRRWQLVQQFCQPIRGLWLDEQVAAGKIRLPGYSDPVRRRAWSRGAWVGPARGSMDEDKEAKAAETRIRIGVSNEEIETAAMTGEPWAVVYARRRAEINQRKKDGTWQEPKPPAPPPPEPDDRPPPPSGG